MFYLEILCDGYWSNEVGEYNNFDTKDEAFEIIPEYEKESIRNSRGYSEEAQEFIFKWRIHDDESWRVHVTNHYNDQGVKL